MAPWGRHWERLRRAAGRSLERIGGRIGDEAVGEDHLEWRCLHTAPPPGRRLRIVYVAMRHDYGSPARGLSFEEHAFYHSLLMMGHELLRFDFMALSRHHSRMGVNRMLLDAVYRYAPDLMFCVLFRDELDPRAVKEVSEQTPTATFNWFTDDHWRYETFSRRWAPAFNWVSTTSAEAHGKYRRDGFGHAILTQWACNPHLFRPLGLPRTRGATFIGQPHGDRRRVIAGLRRTGIAVETWGQGWPAGRISQREMLRVINESKVNLNLSNASRGGVEQVKGRDFEVPGCGGFLLTRASPEIDRCYEVGREIVCYRDAADLTEKIRHYLAHDDEREAIAAAGYRRVLAEHTYEHRFAAVFDRMGLLTTPGERATPPRGRVIPQG